MRRPPPSSTLFPYTTLFRSVEDTSRKLAEKSGVVEDNATLPGTGGPALPLDDMALATLTAKMSRLEEEDRKSTRLNSSHSQISYAVFCLKKKKRQANP